LFRLYEIADGTVGTCHVPTLRGEPGVTLTVKRQGLQLEATLSGKPTSRWQLQLAGIPTIASVEGGRQAADALGVIITPSTPNPLVLRVKL
jgi:hypothetical protein